MNRKLKRLGGALVAVATVLSLSPLLGTTPAGAAGTLQGAASVRTAGGAAPLSSGTGATTFTLRLPANAACTGDSATDGYLVQSYMVPASVDPSGLTFDSNGPLPAATGASFRQPLYDAATTGAYTNALTLENPGSPRPRPGEVINIPNFNFEAFGPGDIPAGTYNVGIACTLGPASATQMKEYWNTQLTFTSNPSGGSAQVSWSVGGPSSAPVLVSPLGKNDTTLTATFTHGGSTPSASFTATATPQSIAACSGASAVTTSPAVTSVTPITITGLRNACTYDVVVTASNGVGSPAVSNVVAGTPDLNPVTGLTATAVVNGVDLSWTAPAGPTSPNGYTVTNTPTGGTVTVTGTTASVTGLTPGTAYTFTVTPTYPSGTFGTPSPASVGPVSPQSSTNIVQDIEVDRPVGTLVLTQRCGVYGALPDDPASPGFPVLAAVPAAGGTTGTAPFRSWDATQQQGVGTPGSDPDNPSFAEYPYPVDEDGADNIPGNSDDGTVDASYPTHCGVDLGYGKLVTSGTGAGQFFATNGRLNQITVVDTRDTDGGWTVTGTASDFTRRTGGTGSFSGNHLGWNPVATSDSAGYDSDLDGSSDYDQVAVRGGTVLPRTIGAAGLKAGQPLGSAAAGSGLGIATFDARLKLLIPVVNDNGRYTATLTFTVA